MKTFFRLTCVAVCAMLVSACATPTIDKAIVSQSDIPPVGEVKTEELGATMLIQKNVEVTRGRRVTREGKGWLPGIYLRANNGDFYCAKKIIHMLEGDFDACITDKEFKEMKVPYEEAEEIVQVPTNFQRVVEYSGKSGNTLSVVYKEFSGELIRPAFTQEFRFDMGESNVIGVKGARIEVIQANNTGITYKVISHFPR